MLTSDSCDHHADPQTAIRIRCIRIRGPRGCRNQCRSPRPGEWWRFALTAMSIFTPEFGIQYYDDIPVVCDSCGRTDTLHNLSQPTKEALIEATSFHTLTVERELLDRTSALAARFPATSHPWIASRLPGKKRKSNPEVDSEVEAELEYDKELREFLENCGFGLARRSEWIDKRLSELRASRSRTDIPCSQCNGFMYLPDDFYMQVGTYLETMAEKKS